MSILVRTLRARLAAQQAPDLQTEADKAADETRKRAARALGRAQTILTSPLGVIGSAPVARKTLLGQ